MFKWLFHILIFATSGKYQNKEKPLKRQRKLGLVLLKMKKVVTGVKKAKHFFLFLVLAGIVFSRVEQSEIFWLKTLWGPDTHKARIFLLVDL